VLWVKELDVDSATAAPLVKVPPTLFNSLKPIGLPVLILLQQ